jgi:hypothetical protein
MIIKKKPGPVTFRVSRTLLFIPALLLLSGGCATSKKPREYKTVVSQKITDSEARPSADPIDKYRSYEIFFRLDKKVDTVKVSVTAQRSVVPYSRQKKSVNVFFLVEKMVDLSKFRRTKRKYIFSEMGRNYDEQWTVSREITIESRIDDPLINLDKTSLYRIRYTAFYQDPHEFNIAVHADCKITLLKTMEQ